MRIPRFMRIALPKQIVLLLLTTLLLTLGALAQEWAVFQPSGEGFSISMPGTPEQDDTEPDSKIWTAGVPGQYLFLVAYTGLQEAPAESEVPDLLDRTVSANLEGAEATETGRRALQWQGWDAAEATATVAGFPYFVRIIHVPEQNRLYVLTTIGQLESEASSQFLDSLTFE